MPLTQYKALTFDCYGTLIDWETGIWNALQPLLAEGRIDIGRTAALETYSGHEADQERQTPSLAYRQILAVGHARLAKHWGVRAQTDMHERFGGSVPDWPAFADSAEALRYLKQHYKLVILSNVDRQSFAASSKKLGAAFDAVYTAEDIGSYKPDPRNFTYLLERLKSDLGIDRHEILHTAESIPHDHVPAEAFGLDRCWINRRYGMEGSGVSGMVDNPPKPHYEFRTLGALAEAHRKAVTA